MNIYLPYLITNRKYSNNLIHTQLIYFPIYLLVRCSFLKFVNLKILIDLYSLR